MPSIAARVFTIALIVGLSLPVRAGDSAGEQSINIEIGGAQQVDAAGAVKLQWRSSDARIAAVFGNGFVVGLRAGDATVTASVGDREQLHCTVHVSSDLPHLVDPSTLKQFDDNRVFYMAGRKCVGSELNGQRADSRDEHRNLESNRVIDPQPPSPDRPLEWEVREKTEVFDGAGVRMGTVAAGLKLPDGRRVPTAKFNFGMSKVMNGRLYVYAFSTPIVPDQKIAGLISAKEMEGGVVGTSAWLALDQVVDCDVLAARIGLGKPRLPALPLKEETYEVTGGDPSMYVTEFGEMAIVKSVRENNAVPSHYLRRPTGTVNLVYSVPGFGLGGQGVDSFLVTSHAIFRPAKGARPFVQPTYFPMKDPRAGQVSPMTMTFIYGAVEAPGAAPVYGWIANEALTRKQP